MFGDIRVLDYGTPEALDFIRENADDLAAVLAEPVQSRRPDFQPREFLHEVRDITAKSGCCLIFDEVITGFRTALGGAQELFGVRADLATYGKVIGGGFPVGVIAGKREFMDALDGGPWQYGDDSIPGVGVTYFAGTFVRHPLALAAAKASLTHLKEAGPALQAGLTGNTAAMAAELSGWCKEVGAPIEIRHFASLWRVSWLEDHPLQDLLFAMMRSRGVHILDNFPCFLTSAHSAEDIAFIQRAFKDSVAEMQESGFLPRRAPAPTRFDVRKPVEDGCVLARDIDGQPFWYVPEDAASHQHLINGKAAA
jgi:glutamate-1-semialdehyde aminotransferase